MPIELVEIQTSLWPWPPISGGYDPKPEAQIIEVEIEFPVVQAVPAII
jgi:hypothetical protein